VVFVGVLSKTAAPAATPKPTRPTKPPVLDVVKTLAGLGHYNTLLGLLNTSGLVDQVLNAPTMTLFAPTDEAFANMNPRELSKLQNSVKQLVNVLSYHVSTEEVVKAKGHFSDHVLKSISGKPVRINVYRQSHIVSAEGVKISEADIHVANGIVHGIDGIMTPPEGDIIDIISQRNDLKTLYKYLNTSGLVDTIKADQNITVFAPTDKAFNSVNSKVIDYLAANPNVLKGVLLYHVVGKASLYSIGMRHAMTFQTMNHKKPIMLIEDNTGDIFIDHARVSERDISATNGVLHVIDEVLIPTQVYLTLENEGLSLIG